MNRRGQFSIIAALLVSVVLVATVIITYSMIRNSPTQELPQVQSPIDETNLALKQVLAFTIGYYGSVLQVTGNSSYAKMMAANYLQSGLINIANMHPDWGASFSVSNEVLSTNWYMNSSYSRGSMSVKYNLTGLGLTGIIYQTSANLSAQVEFGSSTNQAEVIVTSDEGPVVNLGKQNFKFYYYSDSNSSFELVSPTAEPVALANGTYFLSIPTGVNPYSYAIQVVDQRGIMVTVWSFNHYLITLNWNPLYSTLQGETIVMEMLQNGTIRWLGQSLQSTQTLPIPPIPVRAIRINETTTNGKNSQVPFQIEDWNNNYTVPVGLTGNETIFSNRQMIVFLVNHNIAKVTLWWNGSDTAKQTPYAYADRYFTKDNTATGILTNGILTLNINNWLTSTVGSSTATASFMAINGVNPSYGSAPSYVIYHGVVRDIVEQEAEWGGGISNCPNVYSQIVITLPANATYYTYQLQLIFITSSQSRTITSICPIQITASTSSLQTENGTSGGYPIVKSSTGTSYTGTFYNASSVWQHHWSQFISGTTGTGIMFTDNANKMLYAFDTSASKTGALTVSSTAKTIQLLPVTRSSVSFQSAKDVIWYGAVVTFSGTTPIYNSSTQSGLWITVEDPPQLTVTTSNWVSVTVTSNPSGSGYVEVDGNNVTTPYTFTWMTNSIHTLQAISPVSGGTGMQYNFTSWSDGGAQTHNYVVPSRNATVTANYITQYQVSFIVSPSGDGTTTPSGTNAWVNAGTISISVTPNPAYAFSSWTASGSISIANPSQATTTATIKGPGTITATLTLTYAYITVTSSPSGSGFVEVDGSAITTPHTYLWTIGSSHTLQAISPVSETGMRCNFTGWSDGGAQTHTYTVPSQSATVTANYNTQYLLTMATNFGATSPAVGSSWYNSGSTVTISATAPSAGAGEQYVWNGWTGTGSGSYTGMSNPATNAVTMNAPVNETASWAHQYQVSFIVSPSGSGTTSPSGTNVWENAGSLSISASANSGYHFSSWSATTGITITSATSASTTATINAAGTITATFNGPLNHFIFSTISSPQTAGTAFSITITAQDAYGNTVTNYSSSTTLTETGGGAGGTVSPSSVTFSSGVYTGSVYVTKSGSGVTITATYNSVSTASGTFTVNPGSLSKFAVAASGGGNIGNQSSGTPFSIIVTAQDQYSNTITNYSSSVGLSVSGSLTISPTSTGTSGWTSGVWAGSVTLTGGGAGITITASDGSGHTGTSNGFTVFGLDPNCIGFGSGSLSANGGTIATSSMTAQANELIIVTITINSTSHSVTSISDSFATHLNWHQRVGTGNNPYGGNGEGIFEYYAITSSSNTGAFKVNVTISSSAHGGIKMCIQAMGIMGVNTANPFDGHSGLPYTNSASSGTPTVSGVRTSNSNDMLLAFEGDQSSSTQTVGTGFTAIAMHNVNGQGNNAEYEIVSSTQNGVTVKFGSTASNWVMIVDAVERAW